MPGSGRKVNGVLMFVGEGPGRTEDQKGEPFVGRGGKVLDKFLGKAGISRDEVYITNIVKCRPPENRKPLPKEVATCTSNYLEKQVAILKPALICTLGATALEYFTGLKKMGDARGKLVKAKNGFWVFPTYHPASALRNGTHMRILGADIESVPKVLSGLRKQLTL